MSTSQNGYPVLATNRTTGTLPRLRRWQIGGTGRAVTLRDGSAGFLLAHVAHWFHTNIEAIDTGILDDWGWAVRPVRGQTTGYSNHASGTAIDVNATRHPRGVATSKTYTAAEQARIRTQLKAYEGVIRWGGDYTGVPDAMHFELNASLADAERVARALWRSKHGAPIIAANAGAADVIWDGNVPGVTPPPPVEKPVVVERLAIDASYTPPKATAVKAASYRGIIRYGSRNPKKNLTRAEADADLAAGLWVAGVWEDGAARAGEGATAGATDVRDAEAFFDSVGYPRDAVIFYAVDFDATAAQVAPYFDAIKAAAVRPVGVYGSAKVVDGLDVDYYWQTTAWSAGKVSSKANWLQRTTHQHTIGGAAASTWDEDLLIGGNVPVWNPGDAPYTPPPPPASGAPHKVLQANVQQTDPVAHIIARIHGLAQPTDPNLAPDVIVWNELGTGAKGTEIRKAVQDLPGWYSTFASNVGLSWRAERFTHVGDVKVTKVNPGVSGVTEERVIITAQLQDKQTGKTYRQKAGHSVHHVDQGGAWRTIGKIAGQNDRAKVYFQTLHDELLEDKAAGAVCFCGDLNVDLLAELRRKAAGKVTAGFPLATCGTPPVGRVYAPHLKATHSDGRLIDWTILSGRLEGLTQMVLPANGSDHNPVLTTVRIP